MANHRLRSICVFVALIVSLGLHPRPCHGKDVPLRNGRTASPVKLSDPDLFQSMGSTYEVMVAWLDSTRIAGCEDTVRRESALGCQPFSSRPRALSHGGLKRLLRILPSGTWIRSRDSMNARSLLDLGMQFRSQRMHVDLGVRLDSMVLVLFSPGERPVVGSVPREFQRELAAVVAQVPPSSPASLAALQALGQRWGPAVLQPDTMAFEPCDCPGGGEPKFVYYEDAPSPLTHDRPEYPHAGLENVPSQHIILHVKVDKAGRTCQTLVMRGDPVAAEYAMQAVGKWVWKPALSNNKPVCVWVEVPLEYP